MFRIYKGFLVLFGAGGRGACTSTVDKIFDFLKKASFWVSGHEI